LKKYPQVKFVFVGDGFLRQKIENTIKKLNLENNVILTGFREDIPDILNSLDIFVLSSNNEGMAWVVLEAMAMKKAIVATNVSGILESIIYDKSGIVIEYGDREGLAQAIFSFIDDDKKRLTFGEQARVIVQQKFSNLSMLENTEKILLTNER
ncbi:MAG: glycosyltransferase, partial [bacterium]